MATIPTRILLSATLALVAAFLWFPRLGAQTFEGEWTLRTSDSPGKVQLSLHMSKSGKDWQSSSTWPTNDLRGLDLSRAGRQEVQFSIERDAGRMVFEGNVQNGKGAGFFEFFSDPDFAKAMRGMGLPLNEDKHYAMFVHDVSLDFARQMKAADLRGLDTDHLIAFRIHGVSPGFIEELRAAGQPADKCDELIAFRIHGVDAGLVEAVRRAGFTPDGDKLIAFRIHGVSPELIKRFRAQKLSGLDEDHLIAFRIHGVSPELVDELRALGVDAKPSELIAFRIHGVTPRAVERLHASGTPLEADALISAMIHGGSRTKHRN